MAGIGIDWESAPPYPSDDKWYVNYTVATNPDEPLRCQAGPYSMDEIDSQYMDIRGYMGIVDCYKTTFKNTKLHNPSGKLCFDKEDFNVS